MNEELKKMLDSINAKKQEVKDLCKAGKIEDAATAKEELKKLQAQFDLVYDLDVTKTEGMGEKAAAGAAKTIADKAKNIAGAFVNAIKAAVGKGELSTEDKEILNSMNEGKDEDGGLTVTYKITTRYHKEVTPDMFIKFKDRYFQIVSIINVRERNEMLEIVCTEKLTENPAIEKITLNANDK